MTLTFPKTMFQVLIKVHSFLEQCCAQSSFEQFKVLNPNWHEL